MRVRVREDMCKRERDNGDLLERLLKIVIVNMIAIVIVGAGRNPNMHGGGGHIHEGDAHVWRASCLT